MRVMMKQIPLNAFFSTEGCVFAYVKVMVSKYGFHDGGFGLLAFVVQISWAPKQ